jgi:hypothetical protein
MFLARSSEISLKGALDASERLQIWAHWQMKLSMPKLAPPRCIYYQPDERRSKKPIAVGPAMSKREWVIKGEN